MTNVPERPRLPRERLTKTVLAIAEDVARHETHAVRCRDMLGRAYEASFRVVALWAFGSWARGAPTCGDVDLIVDIERVGDEHPSASAVVSAVRRRRHYVDLHVGTPERLGDVATGAVLLWSPEHPDFASAIGSVVLDDRAGRHLRPLDVLPLDARRLLMPFDARDEIPAQVVAGRLALDWRAADAVPPSSSSLTPWVERTSMGRAAKRVLPLALQSLGRWMDDKEIREAWTGERAGAAFHGLGVRLCIERWHHDHREFDRLGCRALVVVPHWTARGPNGVLTLTRGTAHPLVERFAGTSAWVAGDGLVVEVWSTRKDRWTFDHQTLVLDLFTNRDTAEAWQPDEDEDAPELHLVGGVELLDLIDRVDVVTIDRDTDVAITGMGERYLRDADLWVEDTEVPSERLLRRLSGAGHGTYM